MELILVRQEGCGPCDAMNKMAPEKAKKRGYTFRTIDMESMPEDIRPPYIPYFYIMDKDEIVEQWGGHSLTLLINTLNKNKL